MSNDSRLSGWKAVVVTVVVALCVTQLISLGLLLGHDGALVSLGVGALCILGGVSGKTIADTLRK